VPHVEQQQEKALRRIDVIVDHQDAVSGAWCALRVQLHVPLLSQLPCAAKEINLLNQRHPVVFRRQRVGA
jgi:hypothetical protein